MAQYRVFPRPDSAVVTIAQPVAVTQSTTPWVVDVTQFGNSNVVTGTGTSGAGIPRVTVSNDSNVIVSQATAANLNATVTGTVAATQSGTWNINNVSGTVSLPTGAATEASLAKLTLAQGSTTSGQSGTLCLGAVTTASPSYTTAQSNALSLTTSGALRVDASATTQPVSGTVTANIGTTGGITVAQASTTSGQSGPLTQGAVTTAAPTYTTGQTDPLSLTTTGRLRTEVTQITGPALTVTQAAISVGTSAVRLTVSGSAPAATRQVLMANVDTTVTAKFYIGSSSVTNSGATRGIQMVAGQTFQANFDAGDYYIISDTAAQTVFVMEQG